MPWRWVWDLNVNLAYFDLDSSVPTSELNRATVTMAMRPSRLVGPPSQRRRWEFPSTAISWKILSVESFISISWIWFFLLLQMRGGWELFWLENDSNDIPLLTFGWSSLRSDHTFSWPCKAIRYASGNSTLQGPVPVPVGRRVQARLWNSYSTIWGWCLTPVSGNKRGWVIAVMALGLSNHPNISHLQSRHWDSFHRRMACASSGNCAVAERNDQVGAEEEVGWCTEQSWYLQSWENQQLQKKWHERPM